jgi:undecaprenyl-diphosphatase
VFEANATAVIAWSLAALVAAVGVVVIARRRHPAPAAGGRARAGRSGPSAALLLTVGAPAAVFAVVGALVVAGGTRAWDLSVLRLAARHQAQVAVDLAMGVTTLGALPVVLALLAAVLAVLLRRHRWRQAGFVLAASLLALACGGLGKIAFERPRPRVFSSGHDWSFLTGSGSSWSFPSGHATAITGLAAALVVVLWPTRWRWPALVAALLVCAGVGVTRVYLGAHYPTDVIAGWALAMAAVGATRLAFGDPAER